MEELALAASLTLQQMQEHPTCIINAFDQNHTVVFWNNKCAEHFGIPASMALGKKIEELLPWAKSDEKLLFIDRALMGRDLQVLGVPFKLKNGRYEQHLIPVRNSKGEIIAALNLVNEMDS